MEKESFYLGEWLKTAEQTLGWRNGAGLGDYDFEKLSELIFEKTSTRLSISTLKRIWGKVRYESSPAVTTLNALARFLDFPDWRLFTQHIDQVSQVVESWAAAVPPSSVPPSSVPLTSGRPAEAHTILPFFPVVASAMAAFVLLYLLLSWVTKDSPGHIEPEPNPLFESRKVSDGLPNSVVFDYDASGFDTDSIYIQQSWDPDRREKVSAAGRQHTSIYYYPGYFTAKLIVNGEVKKEKGILIRTKGWTGIISKNPTPAYLSESDIRLRNGMGIMGKTFAEKTGSPVFNDAWAYFYNIREFEGLEGGHFTFSASLRNTSTPSESSCRKVICNVLGTRSALMIPLAEKGCIAALNLFTGDRWIAGKDHDLSAFGVDMSRLQVIECRTDSGLLTLSLNGRPILTTPIKQTIGDIIGLCIGFEGAGEITQVSLGGKGKIIYGERFQGR